MAPKSKKGSGATDKPKNTEDEREEPLQAVVLADSYETRFRPFTLEKPRCLLPLANTPLIEYTFEFLANSGVSEVFVYCGAHAEQVEDYIKLVNSPWVNTPVPFNKLEILKSSSHSVGDALRDLDKRALLSGDFVLVYGDVISNISLDSALATHRARRVADKDAIMTMVLREAGEGPHRTKAHDHSPCFVIDPKAKRCLHYEQVGKPRGRGSRGDSIGSDMDGHGSGSGQSSHVTIEADILTQNAHLDIRQDLIDCGIDICTPDALALWSDNFDYEAPRRGFLHSVLKDHELNGKSIHVHILKDGQRNSSSGGLYAARARSLAAYDALSRDIIGRWAYPICPDSNLKRDQSYVLRKRNVFEENGVMLSRSCLVEQATVIGKDTVIGDGSTVTNSVIGRGVNIGKNVTLNGAYIWDHATIGDDSIILSSIVADGVAIGKNCSLEPGALVSFGVTVPDETVVRGSARLTKSRSQSMSIHNGKDGHVDQLETGDEANSSAEYEDSEEENDSVVNSLVLGSSVYGRGDLAISDDSISTLNSKSSSELLLNNRRMQRDSFASIGSDDSHFSGHHANDFHHDASSSIFDSLISGDEPANVQLELTALRMSTNASEHQVRRAVITAFMKRIAQLVDSDKSVKEAVTNAFSRYGSLIERTVFDKKKADKPDQVDFLLLMQTDLAHRKEGESIMLFAANELYTSDILDGEAFEQWWHDERSTSNEELKKVRSKMGQFMDVLLEDTDEESEDEDEEE